MEKTSAMAERGIEKIYDEYLDAFFSRVTKLTKKEYEEIAANYALDYQKHLPRRKDARILDLGCGTGHFLYFLKKEGYNNFWGLDISEQQVNYCKENITEKVQVGDAFDFLINKRQVFDCIVANYFLDHIPKEKIVDFLKLIRESLRSSGVFIVKVPNMNNPLGLRPRYVDITQELGFTEESLFTVLKIAKFVNIRFYPKKIPMSSCKRIAVNVVMPFIHACIRLLYLSQGYDAPKNLTRYIIAVAYAP